MVDDPPGGLHAQLRAWAKGNHEIEAATELLIRIGWARPGLPWIQPTRRQDQAWRIDFDLIPDTISVYSGTTQRLLRIAAAIGGEKSSVNLSEDASGLGLRDLSLVLVAIAHAGGSHEHSGFDVLDLAAEIVLLARSEKVGDLLDGDPREVIARLSRHLSLVAYGSATEV
jgi:hypothetical protein